MATNKEVIEEVIEYIEKHLLEEKLDLETLSRAVGYSKYHLHRMFTGFVGMSVHQYIQRRRLTEAARALVFTDSPIIDIALRAGYETQRSFTKGFKAQFMVSPNAFRRHQSFMPYQLKFDVYGEKEVRLFMNFEIQTVEEKEIRLVGYSASTKRGFHVIGKCWRALHGHKKAIKARKELDFLIGLNDYADYEQNENQPGFTYFAGAQVEDFEEIPRGMETKTLPASRYVVFKFRGKCEDSLEPVVEYVYKEWFPSSTCTFNENNPYDFAKYGEAVDDQGMSEIQHWVPIL